MKRESVGMPVGAASLLVIFAVLCLTIFTMLSMSTAQAGKRLSEASAESVEAWYEADAAAQGILARLRAGELPPEVTVSEGVYSWECPISDSRKLAAAVRLDGSAYTILRWQNVAVREWQPDESLDVWDGEWPE